MLDRQQPNQGLNQATMAQVKGRRPASQSIGSRQGPAGGTECPTDRNLQPYAILQQIALTHSALAGAVNEVSGLPATPVTQRA